jgi:ABC-type multidrug transport system fused ATPase/permease subunit
MNHLAIDNLTFAYTPKHPTLKDVALKIPLIPGRSFMVLPAAANPR